MEILANKLLESQNHPPSKTAENLKSNEGNHILEGQEKSSKEVEKKKEINHEKETKKTEARLKKSEKKNEEFFNTFKVSLKL